ncbi:MAG: glutamate synthase subunit alpha, partial [Bacteroidetes bacterium]|nr:glutamate synthase subunit alpha [Bacteroidota bacterium]
ILIQVPHDFLKEACKKQGFDIPDFGKYGVGMVFFPRGKKQREQCREILNQYVTKLGYNLLGYRNMPVNPDWIGQVAYEGAPWIEQIFIEPQQNIAPETLERKLFVFRRAASHAINQNVPGIGDNFYFTSLSYKTIVYKGQFRTDQVRPYFPDLQDPKVTSALALVHSRFSTNTFPRWRLAQPFRYIAHNGEINTIRGNVNWMRAKENLMHSPYFSQEEIESLFPICDGKHSDSRNLDSMVELLVMSGRSLPHAMMMVIPEAWQDNHLMDNKRKAFYEYHATMMEPWDGPASVCFTDGNIVGATLDRNGLRPSRYTITRDDRLIMASEAGALPVKAFNVKEKGRLQPGKIFVADLNAGRIISDEELKDTIANEHPYGEWLEKYKTRLSRLPLQKPLYPGDDLPLIQKQQLFGITSEELKVVLGPMAALGTEPVGSMGADTPLAILSQKSQHISHYFKQLFAQVSNPPIDPIREKLVMSLRTWIGGSKNVLMAEPDSCKHIAIKQPILTNTELEKIRQIDHPDYRATTLQATFQPGSSLKEAIETLCQKAAQAIRDGATILIVSDREAGENQAPIPALMAAGAVHHYLMNQRLRSETALIVETGDARETHHFATLIGYGAIAINPWMAFESLSKLRQEHIDYQE